MTWPAFERLSASRPVAVLPVGALEAHGPHLPLGTDVVIAEAGRVYLAKDAFVRADQFRRMEPRLAEFERVRDEWDPDRRLRSAQSVRLFGDPA